MYRLIAKLPSGSTFMLGHKDIMRLQGLAMRLCAVSYRITKNNVTVFSVK